MRVGIIQVDGKKPNLALMKISAWEKARGNQVEMYDPVFSKVDRLYMSKIFDFSPDYPFFTFTALDSCAA